MGNTKSKYRYESPPSYENVVNVVTPPPSYVEKLETKCAKKSVFLEKPVPIVVLTPEQKLYKTKLDAIRRNGFAILGIPDPCIELQLEAVNENGLVIQYIKNP